jgi:hypothetical protein
LDILPEAVDPVDFTMDVTLQDILPEELVALIATKTRQCLQFQWNSYGGESKDLTLVLKWRNKPSNSRSNPAVVPGRQSDLCLTAKRKSAYQVARSRRRWQAFLARKRTQRDVEQGKDAGQSNQVNNSLPAFILGNNPSTGACGSGRVEDAMDRPRIAMDRPKPNTCNPAVQKGDLASQYNANQSNVLSNQHSDSANSRQHQLTMFHATFDQYTRTLKDNDRYGGTSAFYKSFGTKKIEDISFDSIGLDSKSNSLIVTYKDHLIRCKVRQSIYSKKTTDFNSELCYCKANSNTPNWLDIAKLCDPIDVDKCQYAVTCIKYYILNKFNSHSIHCCRKASTSS